MRRARVWKTLALVMMLFALATGLCAAKDDGNWVQYYKENDQNVFFVNEDFVKVLEFDGRKYLELAIKCKGTKWESYIFVARPVLVTLYQQNQLLDVETGKYMMFDSSKDTKPNLDLFAKSGKGVNQGRGQALLRWVEQKYPSMVSELREHNKNHPLPNEPSNTGTAAGGAQRTGSIAVDGDWNFLQLLGDGPVQYRPRMSNAKLTPLAMDDAVHLYVSGIPQKGLNIENSICQINCDPSTNLYMIYGAYMYQTTVGSKGPDVIRETRIGYRLLSVFDYDDEANTFTIYGINQNYETNQYFLDPYEYIHIIDKDTVEKIYYPTEDSNFDEVLTVRLQYMKSDKWNDTPGYQGYRWEITESNAIVPDTGVLWEEYHHNEVGADGLFAFLARKGNVGYAPDVAYSISGQF